MKLLGTVLFIGYSLLLPAQEIREGIDHLNSGNYPAAEQFFSSVVGDHPEHRTAQLCYGRAMGLNGKAQDALTLFTRLVIEYPNDYEMKLNYAESMLWAKDFESAKDCYEELLTEDPGNFGARLGYANTLSNLRQYDLALLEIQNARAIQPFNSEAAKSLKFIRIGRADQLMKEAHFDSAAALLTQNLELFEADRETLLNLANVHLNSRSYDLAEDVYKALNRSASDSIESSNGLALVYHLRNRNRKAMVQSNLAIQKLQKLKVADHQGLTFETFYRQAEAYIWNKKFGKARELVDGFAIANPGNDRTIALQASLQMHQRDYEKGKKLYQELLKKDSLSFDGNLGLANALLAKDRIVDSYQAASHARSIFPTSYDANIIMQKAASGLRPWLTTSPFYSRDNAENQAMGFYSALGIPLSKKLSVLGNMAYRSTRDEITSGEASTKSLNLGLRYRLVPRWHMELYAGRLAGIASENNFNRLMIDAKILGQFGKGSNIKVGFRSELQDFNSALIQRNILQNHYFLEYHLSTLSGFGWYSQIFHTTQSDNNNRNLFFTSLYYTMNDRPLLKVGVNYQFISFKERLLQLYFSPEQFHAVEGFVEIGQDRQLVEVHRPFYRISVASGNQFVDEATTQFTYRIQTSLGYKFSHRVDIELKSLNTNVSSASASGFRFTQFQLGLNWYFSERPLFKVN